MSEIVRFSKAEINQAALSVIFLEARRVMAGESNRLYGPVLIDAVLEFVQGLNAGRKVPGFIAVGDFEPPMSAADDETLAAAVAPGAGNEMQAFAEAINGLEQSVNAVSAGSGPADLSISRKGALKYAWMILKIILISKGIPLPMEGVSSGNGNATDQS